MSFGRRQLFLYWRVGADDAAVACAALRQWQRRLRDEHPALRARLFRRLPADGNELTFMETYAVEAGPAGAGIEPALQHRIECEGLALLQPWLRGARHVELFEVCDL
jgi:hypothetical protein